MPANDDFRFLLDWSGRQKRILTANDHAEIYYTAERGFDYKPEELPHHYLALGSTDYEELRATQHSYKPIVGVWNRTLFYGGFDFTTAEEEVTYNLQSASYFIDFRVPRARKEWWRARRSELTAKDVRTVYDLKDGDDLKMYARQHIFAGFTYVQPTSAPGKHVVCARHHYIDWNYVGMPRSRPNKWYVEMDSSQNVWKEWAYAKDDDDQYYYCEHWKRQPDQKQNDLVIVFQTMHSEHNGLLIVIGDHFNYILDRDPVQGPASKGSLVEQVDHLVDSGAIETAQKYLSIRGGHGTVSSGWMIDTAIEPWKEGSLPFEICLEFKRAKVLSDCRLESSLGGVGVKWKIVECNQEGDNTVDKVADLFDLSKRRKRKST